MKDFRDLQVWHKAHELALDAYRASSGFSQDERYGLTSQLRRAAVSIGANLAEGCGRGSDADFARFAQIAMGSASEAEYLVLLDYFRNPELLASHPGGALTALEHLVDRSGVLFEPPNLKYAPREISWRKTLEATEEDYGVSVSHGSEKYTWSNDQQDDLEMHAEYLNIELEVPFLPGPEGWSDREIYGASVSLQILCLAELGWEVSLILQPENSAVGGDSSIEVHWESDAGFYFSISPVRGAETYELVVDPGQRPEYRAILDPFERFFYRLVPRLR